MKSSFDIVELVSQIFFFWHRTNSFDELLRNSKHKFQVISYIFHVVITAIKFYNQIIILFSYIRRKLRGKFIENSPWWQIDPDSLSENFRVPLSSRRHIFFDKQWMLSLQSVHASSKLLFSKAGAALDTRFAKLRLGHEIVPKLVCIRDGVGQTFPSEVLP